MTAPDPRSRLLALLEGSNAVKQGWAEHLADQLLPLVGELTAQAEWRGRDKGERFVRDAVERQFEKHREATRRWNS